MEILDRVFLLFLGAFTVALVDTDKALCGLIALYLFSVPFVILTIC